MSLQITEAVIGLSANPFTTGHRAVGEFVLAQIDVDRVSFFVSPGNPLKDPASYAPAEHRLILAHIGASESPHYGSKLLISDFEFVLPQFGVANETAAMLEHYKKAFVGRQPIWIMGEDNFEQAASWGGRWREIFELTAVVILARADHAVVPLEATETYQIVGDRRVSFVDFKKDKAQGTWCYLEGFSHPSSATTVRNALAAQAEEVPYVTEAQVAHIRTHNLYGA